LKPTQALAAAEKAISLEPALADGWLARATNRQAFTFDFGGAEADVAGALLKKVHLPVE
jgi:hypothetical protein